MLCRSVDQYTASSGESGAMPVRRSWSDASPDATRAMRLDRGEVEHDDARVVRLPGGREALGRGEERLARIDRVRPVRQAVAASAARDDGEVG